MRQRAIATAHAAACQASLLTCLISLRRVGAGANPSPCAQPTPRSPKDRWADSVLIAQAFGTRGQSLAAAIAEAM